MFSGIDMARWSLIVLLAALYSSSGASNAQKDECQKAVQNALRQSRAAKVFVETEKQHDKLLKRLASARKCSKAATGWDPRKQAEVVDTLLADSLKVGSEIADTWSTFALHDKAQRLRREIVEWCAALEARSAQVDALFFNSCCETHRRLGSEDDFNACVDRAVSAGAYPSRLQRPNSYTSGLVARPVWSGNGLPLEFRKQLKHVMEKWQVIRDEALAISESSLERQGTVGLYDQGTWSELYLFAEGVRGRCNLMPKTCDLIESATPSIVYQRDLAIKLSIMSPGTHIVPHCGSVNTKIRAHLGLVVPGQCACIRIATEDCQQWQEGQWLVFDDSFEHEVWNNCSASQQKKGRLQLAGGSRMILMLDLPHPEVFETVRAVKGPETIAQNVSALDVRSSAASLDLVKGTKLDNAFLKHSGSVLAFHIGHDASIAMAKDGRLQCVLELERLFNIRHYHPEPNEEDMQPFRTNWFKALRAFRDSCECDEGQCPTRFKYGVVVNIVQRDALEFILPYFKPTVQDVFKVDKWDLVDHHLAHALLGFHASPFRSALVVSYDGSGNDGTMNAYLGSPGALKRISKLDYSLGATYDILAMLLPEVTGSPIESLCATRAQSGQSELDKGWAKGKHLSFAGKLMGYAATGKPVSKLREGVRKVIGILNSKLEKIEETSEFKVDMLKRLVPKQVIETACKSVGGQRDVAASIQAEFEEKAHGIVMALLEHVGALNIEGIVLTGGCALNVLTNQMIYNTLTRINGSFIEGQHKLGLYVPAAPNDGGLVVGGIYAQTPPVVRLSLQYSGFRLWDGSSLAHHASLRGAKRLSELGGVGYLAELLAGLHSDNATTAQGKPIVAVVRGRQEWGPRALGHRSLLAVPDSNDVRERMNRLKHRQWYRPTAPIIANEALEEVFGREVKSPYMTMAPVVQAHIRMRFPALAHLDGTVRHQSVGKADEPWIHALLHAVGKLTGLAALINTSFNTRGKPIVNTIAECMEMLDTLPDLEFVLIEDWLFEKPKLKTKHKKAQIEGRDEI